MSLLNLQLQHPQKAGYVYAKYPNTKNLVKLFDQKVRSIDSSGVHTIFADVHGKLFGYGRKDFMGTKLTKKEEKYYLGRPSLKLLERDDYKKDPISIPFKHRVKKVNCIGNFEKKESSKNYGAYGLNILTTRGKIFNAIVEVYGTRCDGFREELTTRKQPKVKDIFSDFLRMYSRIGCHWSQDYNGCVDEKTLIKAKKVFSNHRQILFLAHDGELSYLDYDDPDYDIRVLDIDVKDFYENVILYKNGKVERIERVDETKDKMADYAIYHTNNDLAQVKTTKIIIPERIKKLISQNIYLDSKNNLLFYRRNNFKSFKSDANYQINFLIKIPNPLKVYFSKTVLYQNLETIFDLMIINNKKDVIFGQYADYSDMDSDDSDDSDTDSEEHIDE